MFQELLEITINNLIPIFVFLVALFIVKAVWKFNKEEDSRLEMVMRLKSNRFAEDLKRSNENVKGLFKTDKELMNEKYGKEAISQLEHDIEKDNEKEIETSFEEWNDMFCSDMPRDA